MAGPITIQDGGLATQDPNDQLVYACDWGASFLSDAASITTSTWTATVIRPSGATALTTDNTSIVSGNRSTQIRISGGQVGALYEVANKIVTDESPSQTIERSFQLKVENQ